MSDLDMVFAVIQSGISVQLVHYISLLVQRVNNRYGILEKKGQILKQYTKWSLLYGNLLPASKTNGNAYKNEKLLKFLLFDMSAERM